MEKLWVIINTSALLDAHLHPDVLLDGYRIPREKRPSYLHTSRESAEKELARLARNYGSGFLLFEAVAEGVQIQTCAGLVGRVDLISE